MNPGPSAFVFLLIGATAGFASGLFGIGGGVLIVPGLIWLAGFSEHRAIGTSLAVLLPPVALAAAIEYYRRGHVDLRAAGIMAVALFSGCWLGSVSGNNLSGTYLRLIFGLFVAGLGIALVYGAMRRLG